MEPPPPYGGLQYTIFDENFQLSTVHHFPGQGKVLMVNCEKVHDAEIFAQ